MDIQHQKKEIAIVSLDESFFFYDSLVRRVWIDAKKRPVVRITGSHELSCLFGAVSMMDQKQLFRQYNKFNTETFLDFLKEIHHKFPKCYLFLDKAPPHYKSRRVKDYLEENKDTLIPVYIPTASPEFMMLEEVWNIAKQDLLVLKYYSSFEDFRQRISEYFRTKRFGLNMRNYLLRAVYKTYANWYNYEQLDDKDHKQVKKDRYCNLRNRVERYKPMWDKDGVIQFKGDHVAILQRKLGI